MGNETFYEDGLSQMVTDCGIPTTSVTLSDRSRDFQTVVRAKWHHFTSL